MAPISSFYGISSDSVSTLFSSVNKSSASGNTIGAGGILSDYYSIKNGSYKKLITAYYNKSDKAEPVKASSATSADSSGKIATVKSASDKLYAASDALVKKGASSVFARKDGEYNMDGIYEGVKKFVDAYNDAVKEGEGANSSSLKRAAGYITDTTKANIKNLAGIGITVNSDNSLSLNENIFKSSKVSDIQSMFNGAGSYGYSISAKASQMAYSAGMEAGKANTYTGAGRYDYNFSAGDIYDSMF